MTYPEQPPVVVVMGISGSGKSTLAALFAQELGWDLAEGDDLHPDENIAKMAAGIPLTDGDRGPWLEIVSTWIVEHVIAGVPGVITCSALRYAYRETLREHSVIFVHVTGSRELIRSRLESRTNHFMPSTLIDSQLDALEPLASDERGFAISAALTLEEQLALTRERTTLLAGPLDRFSNRGTGRRPTDIG